MPGLKGMIWNLKVSPLFWPEFLLKIHTSHEVDWYEIFRGTHCYKTAFFPWQGFLANKWMGTDDVTGCQVRSGCRHPALYNLDNRRRNLSYIVIGEKLLLYIMIASWWTGCKPGMQTNAWTNKIQLGPAQIALLYWGGWMSRMSRIKVESLQFGEDVRRITTE